MSSGRLFILDGHNILMAFEDLRHLQATDRGEEARRLLEERLEEFANQGAKRVLLVFDGGDRGAAVRSRQGGAGSRAAARFEVVYSRGDGGADRLILDEVRRRAEQGEAVTVVTDDVATLAVALPRGVRHLGVREFWMAHIEVPAEDDEKPAAGDFSDIERDLLALGQAEQVPRPGTRPGQEDARPDAPDSADQAVRSPALSGEALRQEELRRRRERGRLRHERRLKRRPRP